MTILCIETSTSVCSAAVCKDGKPFKQCICREGSNHARLLPRYLDELLAFVRGQGISIEAVALSEGPGSYTGLRIGASTAKGLCYGMNIPLVPIPTLQVLCEAARMQSAIRFQPSAILVPMIDARRMEIYTMYEWTRDNVQSTGENKARAVVVESEESVLPPSLAERDGERLPVYYFGDGAAKCRQVITSPDWHYIPDIVPEAQYMGVLAESQKSKGESQIISGAQLAYYEPFYLKPFIAAQSHVKGLN